MADTEWTEVDCRGECRCAQQASQQFAHLREAISSLQRDNQGLAAALQEVLGHARQQAIVQSAAADEHARAANMAVRQKLPSPFYKTRRDAVLSAPPFD